MQNEPSQPALRASDSDREACAERLRVAATEGRLDPEELESRLDATYAARWCHQLETLTLDVTPPAAAAPLVRPAFVRPERTTNGLAIVSLISAMLWAWWLGSVAAVITGHIALRQINRSGGRQGGRGVAIAGLAIGYLGLLVLALVLFGAAVF